MGEIVGPGSPTLRPPVPIEEDHDYSTFSSGKTILDEWLTSKAYRSEGRSARTFVVCDGRKVVGYYSLATGEIVRGRLPTAKMRQNLPDPVPVIILARLAVDLRRQRQGIGAGLLKDAIERALALHREVGFRGLLVHALDDEAVAFYAKYDFVPCATIDQRTLILPIETAIST